MTATAHWLVLTWRLPSTSSTPRVAAWRSLQRLGAVTLTPGAAIVPYSEHLLEQLEWVAEGIVERGGDAFVLPVTELPEADESEIRRRMRAERRDEYADLQRSADALRRGDAVTPRARREISVLERALARALERDHFTSDGRVGAERAIKLARRRVGT